MKGLANNRKQRQETLKEIIRDLHAGAQVEKIKARFGKLVDQVGPTEIGELEQSLIDEGLAVEEIQKLCDIHVAIFKDSLEKERGGEEAEKMFEEDPLAGFQEENENTAGLVQKIREIVEQLADVSSGSGFRELVENWSLKHQQLLKVEAHYSRKENILFPYLERHGISGPPSVMWGIHDEIRASLKDISTLIADLRESGEAADQLEIKIPKLVLPALNEISEMIYKEEKILFPMCKDTLSPQEWAEVKAQLKDPLAAVKKREAYPQAGPDGRIELEVGNLTPEQINLVLTHLPLDLTYVDENDEVRFFSLGPERIFERTRAVIGRKVQNCHPPASVGVVNRILEEFRSGSKDSADFWINMKGQLIYIRYFAVRDGKGIYRGALEVTQNITEIQAISGEKRIYDY
ncbi:MAG: DUF438 domain-containing protein [Firmicutes bacterium]|nr:DUF438 domain-containing protein [Bacillota bacterium]